MKILHIADLHLGQVIYQNYDRTDEHHDFFCQLTEWCREEQPDALLVCGDVFDIQQPSATTWKYFTNSFVNLHNAVPGMTIVIIAGNHDSAARLQSHSAIWKLAQVHIVGTPPPSILHDDTLWQEPYILHLDAGFIVALPFMTGERTACIQALLDAVSIENMAEKPVVMMAHQAVEGCDWAGHNIDIGHVRTQELDGMGQGYDYLALGHIHKPQTLGHEEDCMKANVVYPSPVARYAGSALHVSCDEAYPHTVSVVEIDKHGGHVHIRQLRIQEKRHFYELPLDGSSFETAEDALEGIRNFMQDHSGYFRLRMQDDAALPSDFNQMVYSLIEPYGNELRYNPKILWTGTKTNTAVEDEPLKFEVAELQQMTDPMLFIEKTKDLYPELDMDELREAFIEIEAEVANMESEK